MVGVTLPRLTVSRFSATREPRHGEQRISPDMSRVSHDKNNYPLLGVTFLVSSEKNKGAGARLR